MLDTRVNTEAVPPEKLVSTEKVAPDEMIVPAKIAVMSEPTTVSATAVSAAITASGFAEGCKDSLPIVISYLPVAFAFGLNASKLGFSVLESVFFSCIIYAGASQFVITAMLAAGSSLWVAALTVMAMDVRHVLYGPSLRHNLCQQLNPRKTPVWAFGLTDEVFAAATAKLLRDNRRWSENWMLGVAICSWLSWVAGTLAGAWSGDGLLSNYPALEAALGFMLPALFMSFLLSSFRRPQRLCVAAALAGALAGVTLFSIPVAIVAGIVAGCAAAVVRSAHQERNHAA